MAIIQGQSVIRATITLALSEEEAAALDAVAGYGVDAFLEVCYKHLGKSYLEPYEKGLRSLFDSVRNGEASVQQFLGRAKDARAVFHGVKVASDPKKKEVDQRARPTN